VFQVPKAEPETLIHLLASLKVMILPGLIVREHVRTFTTHLFILPQLSNPYLSLAAHGLLTSLLSLDRTVLVWMKHER
jgi:hypothetical protein